MFTQLQCILNVSDESPTTQQTKKVVSHFIQFNQSYKCLESTAELVNSTPGAKYRIPETTHKIKKLINPQIIPEYYVQCSKCKNYWATVSNTVQCEFCSVSLNRAHLKILRILAICNSAEKNYSQTF